MKDDIEIAEIKAYLLALQKNLCANIQSYEPEILFQQDPWQREEGGGGLSCVLQQGKVFESAGVNFSHVLGEKLPPAATLARPALIGRRFEALGVSSVLHPRNPYVPTAHLNVRFFIASKENEPAIWWFGGGFDLTPYYPFHEDVVHWHQIAKKACQAFGEGIYPRYKAWADKYFYLPHRHEPRGVGGLFFDDLEESTWGWDFSQCLAFLRSVGDHFWQAYGAILEKRYSQVYTQRERDFQLYRRGRYVEFNLIHDRGTLFGLQSGGRTESILMSLPPQVAWQYHWEPSPNSAEAQLYKEFLIAKEWI